MIDIPSWELPWINYGSASAALVVWSDNTGLHTYLLTNPIAPPSSWIAEWLQKYLEHQPQELQVDRTHTFLYLLCGEKGDKPADGVVDHDAVIELGTGMSPSGNPDGVEVELRVLITAAIEALL